MIIKNILIVDLSIPKNDPTLKNDTVGVESITKYNLRMQEKLKRLFTDGKVLTTHTNETTTIQVSDTLSITVSTKPVAKLKDMYVFDKPITVQFIDGINYTGNILREQFTALLK